MGSESPITAPTGPPWLQIVSLLIIVALPILLPVLLKRFAGRSTTDKGSIDSNSPDHMETRDKPEEVSGALDRWLGPLISEQIRRAQALEQQNTVAFEELQSVRDELTELQARYDSLRAQYDRDIRQAARERQELQERLDSMRRLLDSYERREAGQRD